MLFSKEKLKNSFSAYLIAAGLTWLIGFAVFAAGAAVLFTQVPLANTPFWTIFSGIIRGGVLILYAFVCIVIFSSIMAMIEDFYRPGAYKVDDPMDDPRWPHIHIGEDIEKVSVENERE